MKTFLFDSLNRYKRFSEKLDTKTILCNKTWWVFNDSGEKEIYIFQEDGSLIISINGIVTNATWQFISTNKSLIIKANQQTVMLQPSFVDSSLFCLQLDGTNKYVFLIDENNKKVFAPKTLEEVEDYLKNKAYLVEQKEKEVKFIEEKEIKDKKEALKKEKEKEIKKQQEEENKRNIEKRVIEELAKDTIYMPMARKLISRSKKFETLKILVIALFVIVLGYSFIIGGISELGESKIGIFLLFILVGVLFVLLFLLFLYRHLVSRSDDQCNKLEESIRKKVENNYTIR